jgi:hypothetical protein
MDLADLMKINILGLRKAAMNSIPDFILQGIKGPELIIYWLSFSVLLGCLFSKSLFSFKRK